MSNPVRLDLKYRPSRFSDVLGNQGVVRLLLTRSRACTLHDQSMLLGGPKGCGKTTLARIIARAIHCVAPVAGEPCNSCDPCKTIPASFPGVEELDAASQGTVDRIRSMVADAEYATPDGKPPVYIIDEAQRLTPSAQDALLKAVEERDLVIIMCTTEPSKIKVPIRSRVEEYPVSPPTLEDLEARLGLICSTEEIQADPEALSVISKMTDLCPRAAILALSTMAACGPVDAQSVRSHFRFGSYGDVVKVLNLVDVNLPSALAALDSLSRTEGPVWVRDAMVAAISAGLRADVGARSNFPVSTNGFFKHRLREWVSVARRLGSIDRPSCADIEMAILEGGSMVAAALERSPVTAVAQTVYSPVPEGKAPHAAEVAFAPSKVRPPSPSPKKEPAPASKPPQSSPLEVDGIMFSSDESLTSLDHKVMGVRSEAPVHERALPPVESDRTHVPIPPSEFFRGLIQGIRGH